MCHACSKTAHSGNRGTSDRRVFHAFCDHDDRCWTDQQKISWEMIYCTVWPLIVYHCINIIWNSLHRVSAIEQQPRVLQYLFSLLFFAAVYLLLSITLFRWLPRNGFYQAGPRRTLSAAAVLFLSLFSYYNFYQNRGESNLAVLVQLYCVTFCICRQSFSKKAK